MAHQSMFIDPPLEKKTIERLYNLFSPLYQLTWFWKKKVHLRAIELAQIRPKDQILEVAVGAGFTFLELLKRIDSNTTLNGVDLSKKMIEKTKTLAINYGFTNFQLQVADSRQLPFADNSFHVLYNSYMFDLIPVKDIPHVLQECQRVLKPKGKLVLINLSKTNNQLNLWEKVYIASPLSPFILGGCRPVMLEEKVKKVGFKKVQRETMQTFLTSEIILATK